MSVDIQIIGCPAWGAMPSKQPITWTRGPAQRFILHHTAGHHPEISNPLNESYEESVRFVRDIQHFHMAPPPRGRGWNDSGQNFTVCRNGLIFQGRWRTIRAIQAGKMVVSAHCPGQNEQIGIEVEHQGLENMTHAQRMSVAKLMAWCCAEYGKTRILPIDPHRKYFATSCPANLVADIPDLRARAQKILTGSL